MRTLGIGIIGAWACLLGSCGGMTGASAPPSWAAHLPESMGVEGELTVSPDEREHPAVELRFPWRNDSTSLGWGGVHLWARPAVDNVSVSAIVDAPAPTQRWRECEAAVLDIDGRQVEVSAQYVGREMQGGGGFYDAVQLDLDVLQLRKIVLGRQLGGHICGDAFTMTEDQRATLARFVDWFDTIAEPEQHGDAPFYRDVGPRPLSLPLEDEAEADPLAG